MSARAAGSLVLAACVAAGAASGDVRAADGNTCPRSSEHASAVKYLRLIVSNVDASRSLIAGTTIRTHRAAELRVCDATTFDQGPGDMRMVRRGDVVSALELSYGGRYVATNVEVNIFSALVLIDGVSRGRLKITALNARTRAPMTHLFGSYADVLPSFATLQPQADINDRGIFRDRRALVAGRVARIFGYKAPSSTVVRVFRVQLL